MRRLASAVLLTALLIPAMASAAAPSDIIGTVNDTGRSVSMTMHTLKDGTYSTIWAKGYAIGQDTMSLSATIDTMQNKKTMRTKSDIIILPNATFVRMQGTKGIEAGAWMMVQNGDITTLLNPTLGAPTSFDPMTSAEMFNVQTLPFAGGTTYVFQMKPDAASNIAAEIFNLLGGDRPVIQDFFPWRALAESMNFQMTVKTKGDGSLLSRSLTMDVRGEKSSFELTLTEQATASAPAITAPEGFEWTEAMMLPAGGFGGTAGVDVMNGSFEDIDSVSGSAASCGEEASSSLIALYRSGVCTVEFHSRRTLR